MEIIRPWRQRILADHDAGNQGSGGPPWTRIDHIAQVRKMVEPFIRSSILAENRYLFFLALLAMRKLPEPVQEFKFHPSRKWRMDFAWPDQRIGLEVEGGIWSGGRHTRGKGYLQDMEKYNEATLMGFKLLRVTPKQMDNGDAVELVERLLTKP